MEISPHTNHIARRMFFDTADQNYAGARSAFFDHRSWDFWWLSLHAVEKYLKAILLMNGRSAKGGAHDLPKLLAMVQKIDPRLVPPPLQRPKISGLDTWPSRSMTQFINRLNVLGSADNRYGTYGYNVRVVDLLSVDQLVYWARRHARPLSTKITDGTLDWIAILESDPHYWRQNAGSLEQLADLSFRAPRRWSVTRLNAPFFPEIRHRLKFWRLAASNPPISQWYARLRDSDPNSETAKTARAVLSWVIENIQLRKDDRKELEQLLLSSGSQVVPPLDR